MLTAPLRIRGQPRKRLMIYILVEHQSEPDPLMPLRMLEYVVQIFKFLSYVHALVYHERDPLERGMERGMERGEFRARQTTLIRQLRKRFRDLSAELVQTIEATEDTAQLDEWLDRVVTAKSLREVGIGSST